MRVAAPPTQSIFRSRLQGELLALILLDHKRSWAIHELSERTGEPYTTIATEIRRLHEDEFIEVRNVGRKKLLKANAHNPYIGPLTQLVLMAFGPPLVIGEEFASVLGIERLFIYGSWAARYGGESGPVPNDIDLLVIGQPNRDDIYEAAVRAERRLGHEISVKLRSHEVWEKGTDGFTRQVRSSPLLEIPYSQKDA